jgi:hypothetical protein
MLISFYRLCGKQTISLRSLPKSQLFCAQHTTAIFNPLVGCNFATKKKKVIELDPSKIDF